MIVAAFDISKSATGYAATDGERWESGVWLCPIKKPFELKAGSINAEYAGKVGVWLENHIVALLGEHRPSHAAVESPMPGNSTRTRTVMDKSASWAGQALRTETVGGTQFDVTHFLHGLAFGAATVCARKNIPCLYVASQTWRSTTGVGRPAKGLSYSQRRTWLKNEAKRICGLRGIPVTGADEAEAALIAVWLLAKLNPRLAGHADDLFRKKQ